MRTVKTTAAVLCILAALSCARLETAAEGVQERVLRLHVLAASDTREDQQKKLAARDAVLACLTPLLDGCQSREEAYARIAPQLETLAKAAADAAGQRAEAELLREDFPEREYEGFSLPAGEYEALRIRLEAGAGHNWWCVVFPPLCAALSSGEPDAFALFDEGETALITGSGRVIKFRLLEWVRSFLHRAGG